MNDGAIQGQNRTPALNTLELEGTTGGLMLKTYEATGTATAAKTFSIAVNVPANAAIVGCQMRVDTALTSSDGGTAWSAAFATGSTAACATAVAIAKNSKSNVFFNINGATNITSNTTTITVTCDSSKTFASGGVVRAIVYAWVLVAMDDA